ncbi:MAG: MBL fold metallo-hydrolase [Alicyclobacillaceae bacterium]|nr:MBL fold metallo-hydrolase [Alicyclobacillaceae bacterium]
MNGKPVIDVSALYGKILRGEPVFILDVRNEEEYRDWRIEGRSVRSINVPYFAFLEEEEVWRSVPEDAGEVVVVCAKGGASEWVAEQLRERGRNAFSLEGGMWAWSQFYHALPVVSDSRMTLYQVNRPAKGCLSYVLVSRGEALVVDPARHTAPYLEIAKAEGAEIRGVIDTHLHADHISGGRELAAKTGAVYYLSSEEAAGARITFEPLERHPRIRLGDVEVEVLTIPTPGHTPGSTSLLIDGRYFLSGDTVFVGGLGRPDLGGKAREWAEMLYETVFRTIAGLPDGTYVLPAHFSTPEEMDGRGLVGAELGAIRRNNEIMRMEDRSLFTATVEASTGQKKPPNFETIVAVNRGEETVDSERAAELEIGPNRCAVHHGL